MDKKGIGCLRFAVSAFAAIIVLIIILMIVAVNSPEDISTGEISPNIEIRKPIIFQPIDKTLLFLRVPVTYPFFIDKTWVKINEWSGSGIKTTGMFLISGEQWRIKYKTSNVNIAGVLQIYVYNSESSLETLAANTINECSDVSYIHKNGEYYLEIGSVNEDWEIIIEEFK
jgi:hypothetical protein